MLGSSIRVIGKNGQQLPSGAIGEIVVRGPQLMEGYWGLEDATRDALDGGWLHTGDAGHIDSEGFLFISDRVKDMIVSGGENIYPREIEEILSEMPGIADVAVIGVPSERWGESPIAVVVPAVGATVTEQMVLDHCRAARSARFSSVICGNLIGKAEIAMSIECGTAAVSVS
nr:AMP-binding protein [Nocardia brevicatena]